jgi:hypothetical protein
MERLGMDVDRELKRLGPGSRIGDLTRAWPDLVGESIARNAWPSRVARDGTLHVAASSSAWVFELTQLAPTILERLRVTLGDAAPRALRFAPGPLPEPAAREYPDAASDLLPDPTPEERRWAAELAAEVSDEELRTLVAAAAAASLARAARRPASERSDRRF